MHRISKFAWLLAPVLFTTAGCATKPAFVTKNHPRPETVQPDRIERLLSVAEKYEQQGNTEAAYHLYQQILTQSPTNTAARDRISQIDASQELRFAKRQPDLFEKSQAAPPLQNQEPIQSASPSASPKFLASAEENPQQEFFELVEAKRKLDEQPIIARMEPAIPRPQTPVAHVEQESDHVPAVTITDTRAESTPEQATSVSRIKVAQSNSEHTLVTASSRDGATEHNDIDYWEAALYTEPEVRSTRVPTTGTGWKPVIIPRSLASAPMEIQSKPIPAVRRTATSAPQATNVITPQEQAEKFVAPAALEADDLAPALTRLSSINPSERVTGLMELGAHSHAGRRTVPEVRKMLVDPSPLVRAHAAGTLIDLEGQSVDAIQCLDQLLDHRDDQVLQLAAYFLAKCGPDAIRSVTKLERIRDSHTGLTRLHAAEAIIHIAPHEPNSFGVLESALRSGNREERYFGAVALGGTTGNNRFPAVEALRLALHDEQAEIRSAAALSLGALGELALLAVEDLEHMAQYDFTEVKSSAQTTLNCLAQYRTQNVAQ